MKPDYALIGQAEPTEPGMCAKLTDLREACFNAVKLNTVTPAIEQRGLCHGNP